MKKIFRSIPLLQWLSLLSADIAAVLQTLAMFLNYEPASNYFKHQATLPMVAAIFALIAIATGIAAALTQKHFSNSKAQSKLRALHFSPAVGFFCLLVGISYELLQNALSLWDKHTDSQAFLKEYFQGQTKIAFLCIPLLILSIVYCILWARQKNRKNPTKVAGFGFAAVIACAVLTLNLYFDMSIEMNAPVKTLLQAGCLTSMIFFTTELRIPLKKPLPKLLLAVSTLVITIASLSALPATIAYFGGKIDRFSHLTYALFLLSMLPVAVGHIVDLSFQNDSLSDIPQKSASLDPNSERTSS